MDKNTKIITNIAIAAGVGYGAYLIYKKFKNGSLGQPPVAKTGAEITKEVNEAITASPTPVDEYKVKVMKLQALLNVVVDGNFGPKSNAALSALYGGVFPYGAVSPSNVTKYIEDIELKKTPSQTSGTDAARIARAKQVRETLAVKKTITWTDNAAKIKILKKDSLGNYNDSGKVISFTKGSTKKITFVDKILSNGMIRLAFQDPTMGLVYFQVSPFSFTIY